MRLFIAEKPSLARAIAQALPEPHRRIKTHITCGDGNVVAWCAGHILETAPPEAYRAHYKSWRMGDLPITPREWKHAVSRPELLHAIRGLLQGASRVVHAGDPDREGQLLVDEVLDFLEYRGPVDRLLIRDLSPDAVRTQLDALEPNTKYRPLYESALARQRADWLYGMNMTRLYTLLGRAAGYDGVLSVGRVQTPVLGLIVARDRAIAEFTPAPYYVVDAAIRTEGGETFRAVWVPGPAAEPHLDEDKRLLRREIAEAVRDHVYGQTGSVTAHAQAKRSETPPLPYSLADLQMDAGRRLGLSAKAVLDACQSLYETHRLTTYPRSDCAHLPEAHHAQAKDVAAASRAMRPRSPGQRRERTSPFGPRLGTIRKSARTTRSSRRPARGRHPRSSPTPSAPSTSSLPGATSRSSTRPTNTSRPSSHSTSPGRPSQPPGDRSSRPAGRRFGPTRRPATRARATARRGVSAMARRRCRRSPKATPSPPSTSPSATRRRSRPSPSPTPRSSPPCAPSRSLSRAHTAKKILSETDGIGTPATRAAIIETLFERGYVARDKRTIVSTETGRALIGCLPEVATTPDMTAVWEAAMRAITDGSQSLDAFLTRIGAELGRPGRPRPSARPHHCAAAPSCPRPRAPARRGPRDAPHGRPRSRPLFAERAPRLKRHERTRHARPAIRHLRISAAHEVSS